LSWTEGGTQRSVESTLCDISLGGGAALATSAPTVGAVLWFRLQGDETSPWVEARVVSVAKTGFLGFGRRLIRWQFPDPCPYQIFKAAIQGFSRSTDIEEQTHPGFEKRDWRD